MLAYEGLPVSIHHNGRNRPFIPFVQSFSFPPPCLIPSSFQLRNYLLAQHWAHPRNYALRHHLTSQSRVQALENYALHVVPFVALVRIRSSSVIDPQWWLHNAIMENLQRENQLRALLIQRRRYHNLRRRNLNQREENQILANGIMLAPLAQQRDNRNGNLVDGIVLALPTQQRDNRNPIDGIVLAHPTLVNQQFVQDVIDLTVDEDNGNTDRSGDDLNLDLNL
ncbi:hypothetical protein QQP08_013392 [Theobroma cacao]|nr:hypothetical protein QQP08_013392 [Theobroma cacao]